MARQPVQLPSRGGANAAGVGNRAQYLRPAKDTQNSRALASAFSQMNRAFGRIASNEQRISNQQMADELREAEEEQQILEQRAAVAGQIDVLTGQDQSSAFANNEMALKSYSEGHIQASMSEGLIGIGTEFKEQPFYGDPLRQQEAEQWIQDNIQTAIGQAPVAVVGSMLPQIQKLGFNLLQDNDAAVFETAKAQTVTDMQSNLYLSLIGGDSEAFIGVAHLERENAGLDIGKVAANESIVKAFGFALDRAAGGSEGEWRRASDAATDLLRSEFMQGLSAAQQGKMRDLEVAARQHFNSNQNERSRRAQDEANRQIGVLQTGLQDALESGMEHNGYKALFMELDPEGGEALYQKQLDAHYQRFDYYLPRSDANDMSSAMKLAEYTHTLDAGNIQPGTKKFNDKILDWIAEGALTQPDAEKLKAHDTNMGLEVKSNPEYQFTINAFRSFSDAVVATVPGIAQSVRATGEMRGFEADGSDFRKLQLLFEQELKDSQKSYPQDAAGQKEHIDDAAYRAMRRYLTDTEYKDASGETRNLLDKMEDMEGGLDKLIKGHPAFRQLFDELGYFEREEKRNAEIEAAKAQAAEIRRQNDAAMDETLLPSLPAAEQATETPALTPREKSLEDIDRLLSVTQSLKAEADQLAQADRAEQREQATAEAGEELEEIDFALEQARLLEQEAGVLQQAIQEDIKALDQEIALQQTAVEQAKAAAAEADAVMRQLQAGLQLQNMQPAEPQSDPVSSGRGEPATAPPIDMPSQMSTLDVPETSEATVIPTSSYEASGQSVSSSDAQAIPGILKQDSTANIVLEAPTTFKGENVKVFSKSRDEFTSAERKSTEGDRIISLDFNAATNTSAKGVEIVIPSDATAAEKKAAKAYVDAVEAFFKKHGHDSYPNRGVKVSGKGVSGKKGYFHTEPFFIADAKAVEIIKEHPAEYAQILAETLGILDGARFIAPHEKGAEGASGSIGSERAFALETVIPELEKYMGEN